MGKINLFSEKTMEKLLHKHAPVLLLHKDEKFLPIPVECFFNVAVIKNGEKVQTIKKNIKRQFTNTKYQDRLIINPELITLGSGGSNHKEFLLNQQKKWLNSNNNKLTVYIFFIL